MKQRRRQAILDIVRGGAGRTQGEIAAELTKLGISTTQATISRDLSRLGLGRSAAGWQAPEGGPGQLVTSIQEVEFLCVVRTPPGSASLVARAVDEAQLEGVAGTVAGDDTILVVLGERAASARLRRFLGV